MSWKPCWCPPSDTARTPLVSDVFKKSKKIYNDEPLQEVKTEVKDEPPKSPRDDTELVLLREHTDDEDKASLSSEEEIWLDEAESDEDNVGGIKEEEEEEVEEEVQDEDEEDAAAAAAAADLAVPSDTLVHPRKIWQQLPRRLQKDIYGYGRNPAFWFT